MPILSNRMLGLKRETRYENLEKPKELCRSKVLWYICRTKYDF